MTWVTGRVLRNSAMIPCHDRLTKNRLTLLPAKPHERQDDDHGRWLLSMLHEILDTSQEPPQVEVVPLNRPRRALNKHDVAAMDVLSGQRVVWLAVGKLGDARLTKLHAQRLRNLGSELAACTSREHEDIRHDRTSGQDFPLNELLPLA